MVLFSCGDREVYFPLITILETATASCLIEIDSHWSRRRRAAGWQLVASASGGVAGCLGIERQVGFSAMGGLVGGFGVGLHGRWPPMASSAGYSW